MGIVGGILHSQVLDVDGFVKVHVARCEKAARARCLILGNKAQELPLGIPHVYPIMSAHETRGF
jgi:hypothetical protein